MSAPSADLWLQFPIIGIILLSLIAIGWGLRTMFHEFTAWQDREDTKREGERARQREWESAQTKAAEHERDRRDRAWQTFFERLNQQNREAIIGNGEALEQLIKVIRELSSKADATYSKLIEHDERAKDGFSQALGAKGTNRSKKAHENNHVIE